MTQKIKPRLPNREEMSCRLRAVLKNAGIRKMFIPLLLRHSGEEYSAGEFVQILTAAIRSYLREEFPEGQRLIFAYVPKITEALYKGYPEFVEEAVKLFEDDMMSPNSRP